MRRPRSIFAIATALPIAAIAMALVVATPTSAHNGVKDPNVMARMMAMGEIAKATKTLGDMARGVTPLHQAKARMARDTIVTKADKLPVLFETNASDPKSEALPLIWDNWADFTARTETMKQAAIGLEFTDKATLSASLRALGSTCGGCHKRYRIDK